MSPIAPTPEKRDGIPLPRFAAMARGRYVGIASSPSGGRASVVRLSPNGRNGFAILTGALEVSLVADHRKEEA